MSLRDAGEENNGYSLVHDARYTDVWDADRIQGCVCDYGWEGYDCSQRSCPRGDDPLTQGQVDELQTLHCSCPGNCTGHFHVRFMGQTTDRISANAVLTRAEEDPDTYELGRGIGESLESRLEALRTIEGVIVFANATNTTRVCAPESEGGSIIHILFNERGGDVPALEIISSVRGVDSEANVTAPASLLLYHGGQNDTRNGNTEFIPCSGRGLCETNTGVCVCFAYFGSSDGDGNSGQRGDCGFAQTAILDCPNALERCSARGVCDNQEILNGSLVTLDITDPIFENETFELTCNCYEGYTGGDCSQQVCPKAAAWFDEPFETNRAHQPAECANRGLCNRQNGQCTCQPGFSGVACERLDCPVGPNGRTCSGRGRCLTLAELAERTTKHGERIGVDEVQRITCSMTDGNFTVGLRHHRSFGVPWDANEAKVREQIEYLPTVGFVEVTFNPGPTACSENGTEIYITYVTDGGDMDQLEVYPSSSTGSIVVDTLVNGTRITYGKTEGDETTWDAHRLRMCHCDATPAYNLTDAPDAVYTTAAGTNYVGYLGGDLRAQSDRGEFLGPTCSLRPCPTGHDPLSGDPGDLEVQRVTCNLDLLNSSLPTFLYFTFMDQTTAGLPLTATAADLKAALEALPSIGLVDVVIESNTTAFQGSEAGTLCDSPTSNYTLGANVTVTFLVQFGDLPLLHVDVSRGDPLAVDVFPVTEGTRQNIECAGRGRCNAQTGLCDCFNGFVSSDGTGRKGRRGDCGSQDVLFKGKLGY